MSDILIGKITHYFDKIGVGVLVVTDGAVAVGDTIRIGDEATGFTQPVDSLQVNHTAVSEAKEGDEVGLKLLQPAKENTLVYKVEG